MKVFKRLLAAIICVSLLVCALPAGAFPDLQAGSEVRQAAEVLQMMGVLSGYSDGRFHENDPLTRAQFCKMAITVMDADKQAPQYAAYTIFPDVKSSHWAAGYINLAVRDKKIIAGYPSGSFAPDDSITYAQGVTILMRILGYTDKDLGMNWPYSYLAKAAEIGLTDSLDMDIDAAITRGAGAMLFKNLLTCPINGAKDSKSGRYIKNLPATAGFSVVDDLIVISNSAKASDGTENSVMVAGAALPVYKTRSVLPDSFVGVRGSLVLDRDGYVKTFLPDRSVKRQVTVSESEGTYIKTQNDEKINIDKDVSVFLNGEEKKYSAVWPNIYRGTEAVIYFTSSGTVDYILFGSGSTEGDAAKVLRYNSSQTANPFFSMFNVSEGEYRVYKNGVLAESKDMRQYDVAVLNRATKTINVTDFKLPGVFEDASPNTKTPTRLSSFGMEFEVLSTAINDLQKFKIGDQLMLLMTPDFKVAGAIALDHTALPVGVLTAISDGSAEVTFLNGFKVKGEPANTTMLKYEGELVKVASYKKAEITASKVTQKKPTVSFDVTGGKVGSKELSPFVRIFETANGGTPCEIRLEDILTETVYSTSISHVGYDYAGRPDLIILDNVTYDSYIYGTTSYYPAEDGLPSRITVRNGDYLNGRTPGNAAGFSSPPVHAGVAFNSDNKVVGVVELKMAKVKRSDFDGSDYIIIGAERYKIASNVQCLIKSLKEYTTSSVDRIKGFSEEFTVYYDRDAASGGKIRIIEAE